MFNKIIDVHVLQLAEPPTQKKLITKKLLR